MFGHRSDLNGCCGATPSGDPYGLPYDGQIINGPTMHGPLRPTPAEPEPMAPDEDMNAPETPPAPPVFPGPMTGSTPKTRSALKKVDGRPAVYYARRPEAAR
jgi:hypothetical protein